MGRLHGASVPSVPALGPLISAQNIQVAVSVSEVGGVAVEEDASW